VVEHLDHFQVLTASQRQQPVARAEAWMNAAVHEILTELPRQLFGGLLDACRAGSEGDVVQVHS
jgi:hypothetical protein